MTSNSESRDPLLNDLLRRNVKYRAAVKRGKRLEYNRRHGIIDQKLIDEDMVVEPEDVLETCQICAEDVADYKMIQLCDMDKVAANASRSNRLSEFTNHRMCHFCFAHYISECLYSEESISEGSLIPCPFDPEHCPPLVQNTALMRSAITLIWWIEHGRARNVYEMDLEASIMRHNVIEMQVNEQAFICPTPGCNNISFVDADRLQLSENYYMYEAFPTRLQRRPRGRNLTFRGYNTGLPNIFNRRQQRNNIQTRVVAGSGGSGTQLFNTLRNVFHLPANWFPAGPAPERRFLKIDGNDLRKFKCSECHYTSCVVCKRYWTRGSVSHENLTCDEFSEKSREHDREGEAILSREEIELKIASGIMKRCPSCSAVIEKNGGCVYMECRDCRRTFCWHCLKICRHGNCPTKSTH